MNTYRYDTEQIRSWVRQKLTREKTVKQICSEAVISRATLYNWINEFPADSPIAGKGRKGKIEEVPSSDQEFFKPANGSPVSAYRMLSSALSYVDTDGVISKKMVSVLVKRFTITVAQACEIVGITESAYGYKPRKPEVEDEVVADAITRLINEDPYRGFTECYELLRKEHPAWTRKQIKRVYREDRLYLKRTRKNADSNKALQNGTGTEFDTVRLAPLRVSRPGATWYLGMIEGMTAGSAWHMLFILDEEDETPLNARIYTGKFSDEDLVGFLSMAERENGMARKLKLPAGLPLNSRELTSWVWQHKMVLHTISMGKPENLELVARIEEAVKKRFSGKEASLDEAQLSVENWLSGM